jgi:hypothetical protein
MPDSYQEWCEYRERVERKILDLERYLKESQESGQVLVEKCRKLAEEWFQVVDPKLPMVTECAREATYKKCAKELLSLFSEYRIR